MKNIAINNYFEMLLLGEEVSTLNKVEKFTFSYNDGIFSTNFIFSDLVVAENECQKLNFLTKDISNLLSTLHSYASNTSISLLSKSVDFKDGKLLVDPTNFDFDNWYAYLAYKNAKQLENELPQSINQKKIKI